MLDYSGKSAEKEAPSIEGEKGAARRGASAAAAPARPQKKRAALPARSPLLQPTTTLSENSVIITRRPRPLTPCAAYFSRSLARDFRGHSLSLAPSSSRWAPAARAAAAAPPRSSHCWTTARRRPRSSTKPWSAAKQPRRRRTIPTFPALSHRRRRRRLRAAASPPASPRPTPLQALSSSLHHPLSSCMRRIRTRTCIHLRHSCPLRARGAGSPPARACRHVCGARAACVLGRRPSPCASRARAVSSCRSALVVRATRCIAVRVVALNWAGGGRAFSVSPARRCRALCVVVVARILSVDPVRAHRSSLIVLFQSKTSYISSSRPPTHDLSASSHLVKSERRAREKRKLDLPFFPRPARPRPIPLSNPLSRSRAAPSSPRVLRILSIELIATQREKDTEPRLSKDRTKSTERVPRPPNQSQSPRPIEQTR